MTRPPWSSGNAAAVKLPHDASVKNVDIHHNHPTDPNAAWPISVVDMEALLQMQRKAPGWAKAIYAHEGGGGTSVAKRAGRTGHKRAADALESGRKAASKIAPAEYGVGDLEAIATAQAAARQRLISYGYEPHEAAAIVMRQNAPALRQATDAAYRAMHGPIHGLPYPITWGGIGAGAVGLGGAAYGMSR
jgi:hypothetical protein